MYSPRVLCVPCDTSHRNNRIIIILMRPCLMTSHHPHKSQTSHHYVYLLCDLSPNVCVRCLKHTQRTHSSNVSCREFTLLLFIIDVWYPSNVCTIFRPTLYLPIHAHIGKKSPSAKPTSGVHRPTQLFFRCYHTIYSYNKGSLTDFVFTRVLYSLFSHIFFFSVSVY